MPKPLLLTGMKFYMCSNRLPSRARNTLAEFALGASRHAISSIICIGISFYSPCLPSSFVVRRKTLHLLKSEHSCSCDRRGYAERWPRSRSSHRTWWLYQGGGLKDWFERFGRLDCHRGIYMLNMVLLPAIHQLRKFVEKSCGLLKIPCRPSVTSPVMYILCPKGKGLYGEFPSPLTSNNLLPLLRCHPLIA